MTPLNLKDSLILLVDDIPANLHVLVAALKDSYRIKTATSGKAALEIIDKERPDLILLDVMMPEMSGIEVMRQLRRQQETRDIAVIFVSADASEQTQLDGFKLGADDYLIKPIATRILQTRVHSLLLRKDSERQLRLAAQVFESSGEAIMITDKNNCIIEVNHTFTSVTGYGLPEVKGQNPKLLSAGRTDPDVFCSMWQGINAHGFWQGELWDKNKNGRIYPKWITISVVRNAYYDIDFYIASFIDISERIAAEEHISRLAHRDTLTGLFNRFSLQDGLAQALARAKREKIEVAILIVDLDHFKNINDTLGHAAGDALLIEAGVRMRKSVRETDIVARWGGDEFVVLLTKVENSAVVARVAEKIRSSLDTPYQYQKRIMISPPSIGVSMFPGDGENGEILMRNADMALYHAKGMGRNNIQFFSVAMSKTGLERMKLEHDLSLAQELQQLELHYQPQFDAKTSKVIGFEALVRWNHPELGLVYPGKFIPIAEQTGLILSMGDWVINEACCQLKKWRDQGCSTIGMAVNISALQLHSPTLLANIVQTLKMHGLDGSDLELEVTESVAMQDPVASIGQLNSLRIMGVKLSIDDFGTGYSSLSYLKQMPVQMLKLDQSFVRDIETDKNDAVICEATIKLAHNLGLRVVAEGVETEEQRKFLVALDCDILQGYLFSKPVSATDARKFIDFGN